MMSSFQISVFGNESRIVIGLPFFFNSDYLFKIVLIGDSGVGKSSLLLRFAVLVIHSLQ